MSVTHTIIIEFGKKKKEKYIFVCSPHHHPKIEIFVNHLVPSEFTREVDRRMHCATNSSMEPRQRSVGHETKRRPSLVM
jgi:hypothetical protein